MATTCFRTPPLPPSGSLPPTSCGRKSSTNVPTNNSNDNNNNSSNKLCGNNTNNSSTTITTIAIVEHHPSSSIVNNNSDNSSCKSKSSNGNSGSLQKPVRKKSYAGQLSSTYRSFRDPVEEDEIQVLSSSGNNGIVNEMEIKPIVITVNTNNNKIVPGVGTEEQHPNPLSLPLPPRAKSPGASIVSSSSLRRGPKLTLFRSHSEGDLSIAPGSTCDITSLNKHNKDLLPLVNSSALNKCLRVLTGSWKNLFQLGGMSRPPKPAAQVKKVAPPAVPSTPDTGGFRNSGSSFGSAGYGSAGEEHSSYQEHTITTVRDGGGYDVTDVYGMPVKSPPPGQFNYPAFTFPGPQYNQMVGTFHHGTSCKTAAAAAAQTAASVYYHHQLSLQEDQGIDMTQSPGRDSPGSSGSGSRHSTASLDSGRASGCHLGPPHHPRCSLSSSSVGSSDTQSGPPSRVERLLLQGVPDQEVLHGWLLDLHFEEYFPLFVSAGYDMHTISRMTPEDLTAIGIKKPNHRKKLKAEIAQLNISDGLPDYIPGSLDEWLRLLRLEEYGAALGCQGYSTIEDVTQLTWEDLEDIGIVKLGHQKKILLAIKRVKDLRAGKTFPPPHTPTYMTHQDFSTVVGDPAAALTTNTTTCECPRVHTTYRSFHQPWEIEATRHLYYATDIVPIKIRGGRGKSLESLEEGMSGGGGGVVGGLGVGGLGGTSSFVPAMPPPAGWRPRSFDDGDITPTNESLPLHEGGGTLPRPRGLVRPRPVAKIPATFCPAFRPEDVICSGGTLKRLPPSPPKRSQCDTVQSMTVVADLHCIQQQPPPPPAPGPPIHSNSSSSNNTPPLNSCGGWSASTESQLIATLKAQGSDSSFKSSSSTESDSLPFANENAGTIKQRVIRTGADYIPPVGGCSSSNSSTKAQTGTIATSESCLTTPVVRKSNQEPADVLNDIGNMLANLTDELDAMLEEEKRQGLTDE
ncbi:CRK like proto-oncogene, adaptor protein isoform X2 [Lycorma delicatula]|uniref:CRK like proto-oncogene, adaptor protein isoform X2 n=1 Tax=Lycorma delicatula TaxID=130591 RepID=UPI003F514502